MATLEERVTILETTMSEVQNQVLARATSDEVAALETGRTTAIDNQQTTTDNLAIRIGKLERALAAFQLLLARIPRKNTDGYIAEDLPFAEETGPVIQDADGVEWRIVVATDGELSAEEA